MATQSPSRPAPSDGSAETTAHEQELSEPVEENGHAAKSEVVSNTSDRPFLLPSEPIREDQVQNAVKFLSHPKVRGSPIIYRRSFLEKKGLTKEEIDEAFHRVPDPPSNSTVSEAVTTNKVVQPKPSSSLQPQAHVQPPQPAGVPISSDMVPSVQKRRFQWSHALIAAGVLAASGAGTAVFFKNVVVPRLKSWIRNVVAEENESEKEDKQRAVLVEETAEAAKVAVTAAAVVAKASEELLNSKNEERKYFEAFMSMMDVQVKEMKSMGEAIRKLESTRESSHSQDKMVEEYIRAKLGNGTTNNSWRTSQVNQSNTSVSSVMKQVKANDTTNPDYGAETVEPTSAPHPKSYMEPWEVTQQKTSYNIPPHTQPSGDGSSSRHMENGSSFDTNGKAHDSSEPWWKKKTVKITEVEHEAEELGHRQQQQQQQPLPYNMGGSVDRPVQRSWVPPQPPSVAIPEAAAAIRQPKPSGQKRQLDVVGRSDGGEDSVATSDDVPKPSGQKRQLDEVGRSDGGEDSVATSDDVRIEGEASGTIPAEQSRSEVEEERETSVEIS